MRVWPTWPCLQLLPHWHKGWASCIHNSVLSIYSSCFSANIGKAYALTIISHISVWYFIFLCKYWITNLNCDQSHAFHHMKQHLDFNIWSIIYLDYDHISILHVYFFNEVPFHIFMYDKMRELISKRKHSFHLNISNPKNNNMCEIHSTYFH